MIAVNQKSRKIKCFKATQALRFDNIFKAVHKAEAKAVQAELERVVSVSELGYRRRELSEPRGFLTGRGAESRARRSRRWPRGGARARHTARPGPDPSPPEGPWAPPPRPPQCTPGNAQILNLPPNSHCWQAAEFLFGRICILPNGNYTARPWSGIFKHNRTKRWSLANSKAFLFNSNDSCRFLTNQNFFKQQVTVKISELVTV